MSPFPCRKSPAIRRTQRQLLLLEILTYLEFRKRGNRMSRTICMRLVAVFSAFGLAVCLSTGARADDANAVIDKAIKALGGEEQLAKVKAAAWKSKGTITFQGNDNEV